MIISFFFLSLDTESINFDHHLRCGGWLNFEFSYREKHSGWAIRTGAFVYRNGQNYRNGLPEWTFISGF